jgi:hypothetical protein
MAIFSKRNAVIGWLALRAGKLYAKRRVRRLASR